MADKAPSSRMGMLKKIGVVVLLSSAAALLLVNHSSSKSTDAISDLSTGNEGMSEMALVPKVKTLSTVGLIHAWNEYSTFNEDGTPIALNGKAYYKALEKLPLVEPHRITTFGLIGLDLDEDASYKWEFSRSERINSKYKTSTDESGDVETVYGSTVTRVFRSGGYKYDVSLTVTTTSGVEYCYAIAAACMYVRRELRSLNENDRSEMLAAMWVPYSMGLKEGVKIYGEEYLDMLSINSMHNYWAADMECDHLHDGAGFATQHLAITIRYEAAIQSINPRVVMPYWEYTIESSDIVNDYNGNFDKFYEISPVFSVNWFGNFDTMQEPWSEIVLAKSTLRHNPFGFMRSPWNFASDSKVLRYRERCGYNTAKLLMDMELPSTCASFAEVLDIANFEKFQSGLMHAPHGSIHIMLGGIAGDCATGYTDNLVDHFDDINLAKVAQLAAISVKGLWRAGYIIFKGCTEETADQCSQTCSGTTTADYLAMGEIVFELFTPWGIKPRDGTNNKFLIALGKTMCSVSLDIGDMYSSSATIDPLFWVMHTTTDRLMTYKRAKTFAFTETTWSDVSCLGHSPGDNMFFDISKQVGPDDTVEITNIDLLSLSDPQSEDYGLPYIYDSFDYSHCDYDLYPQFASDYYPTVIDDDLAASVSTTDDAPTPPADDGPTPPADDGPTPVDDTATSMAKAEYPTYIKGTNIRWSFMG